MKINKSLKSLLLIAGLVIFQSCSMTSAGQVKLSPKEFQEKLSKFSNPQLIDVRAPEEFMESHLQGSRNIDYYQTNFASVIQSLDKTQPVFIYCRSGNRSSKAADVFFKAGFTQVYDLSGGIIQWIEENYLTTK
jgi:rhodanese-related sulfurtransferase